MRTALATTKRELGTARTQLKATKAQLAIQVADLQRLHQLGTRLSTHVELPTLLEEVLAAVCSLQHAPVGLLLLFDRERRDLHTVATVGLAPEQARRVPRVPIGIGPCGLAVSERRPFVIKDLRREQRFEADRRFATEAGYRALSCFPLQARTGQIVGAIATFFPKPHAPTAREMQLVELYGVQAAEFIENARLYADMKEASRLKDEFLATLSHEIRTPLNAVLGWTRVLRLSGDAPGEARHTRALQAIERNSRIQAQLVDDLLDVSTIVTGKLRLTFEPVNLATVVEAALDTVRPAIENKRVQLDTELAGEVVVFGDAARLQQVVWNLLSNAARLTADGGRIRVALERHDGSARLVVSDTGIGIAPDFLAHVFDRFRQGDGGVARTHRGLGLGLAIVRHVVEAHGGSVTAASTGVGHGATFTVLLPLGAMAAPPDTVPAAAVPQAPSLRGVRILVVEDEADARELLVSVLDSYGAVVAGAGSGVDALAALNAGAYDVLIADIGMVDMNGYALIRTIRALADKADRPLPAIALTVYATTKERDDALAAGFDRHIVKPIDPESVARTVQELVDAAR
ncbi:MAG: multi-sensor hybrid histidine kinase [Acidobacteria bacterium]|nr:multi-sensor hybrid histidine kinase [Acidobacteriota bacterium]